MTSQVLHTDSVFDVTVIGGGLIGLGIARELTRFGFSVCVLEKNEFGGATSGNSHRIIHGGFRYLKDGNFYRTVQSIIAKRDLLRERPEIVSELACLMPLEKHGMRSVKSVRAALFVYDQMCRFVGGVRHTGTILSSREASERAPILSGRADAGALLWYDGFLENPKRLVDELLGELGTHGVFCSGHAEVTAIKNDGSPYRVSFVYEGREHEIESSWVINASGPWIEEVRARLSVPPAFPKTNWCLAFNLVTTRQATTRVAVASLSPNGRLFFLVPREEGVAIGTGYLPREERRWDLRVSDEDSSAFLREANTAFPGAGFLRSEVVRIEEGCIPCRWIGEGGDRATGDVILLGKERVYRSGRYIEVLSTKLTTFEVVGRRVARIVKWRTRSGKGNYAAHRTPERM